MSNRSRRRVALLVHTASDWTRLLLRGVASFVREADEPWDVLLEPRGYHEKLSLPRNQEFDGVILRLTHPGLKAAITRRKLPAINVSWLGKHSQKLPSVGSDERGCAELSVRHLQEKGFTNIAYVGPNSELAYGDTIPSECKRLATGEFSAFRSGSDGNTVAVPVGKWLQTLSKPVGIVAWNAAASKQVLDACLEMNFHVPNEVGIVCIEHDHLIAALAGTPLTSIDQDPSSVGFEAARLLDSMMQGAPGPEQPVLIRPHGIICRQSTEAAMTEDAVVKRALEFIQENFSRPIRVGDICSKLDVSRRQLENRFRHAINSTPANEVKRTRLSNVKRLLVETTLGMDKIATMSGYDYTEVMIRAFKQTYGTTPGDFRKSR